MTQNPTLQRAKSEISSYLAINGARSLKQLDLELLGTWAENVAYSVNKELKRRRRNALRALRKAQP